MQRDVPGFRWQLGWGLGKSQPQARSWGAGGVSWEVKVKVTHGSPCLVSLQSFVDTCLLVSSKISWTIPSLAFHPGLFLNGFLTHSSPSTVWWVIHLGQWFPLSEAGHSPPLPRVLLVVWPELRRHPPLSPSSIRSCCPLIRLSPRRPHLSPSTGYHSLPFQLGLQP